jgi:MoxR-like ATPase
LETVSQSEDIRELLEKIQAESAYLQLLRNEIGKVIVGQQYMVDRLLIALLADGHIMLEGVPGLAKTLAIRTLSDAISGSFSRIQFTPDLLPADITGTMIYNQKTQDFTVTKGPVFANFVLADEINRAPAKVQAALLEAMQERQVTLGDESYLLPEPFLVMATQNPIEQEGTYPLPEAQVDRFMLKVYLDYPKKEEEKLIVRSNVRREGMDKASPVLKPEDIIRLRNLTRLVYLDEKIEQYIVDLVFATRNPAAHKLEKLQGYIAYGGSPRASINLALAAKAHAFLQKRAFVIPEDVRAIAPDVLRHRIGLTYEAEADNVNETQIIKEILTKVDIP